VRLVVAAVTALLVAGCVGAPGESSTDAEPSVVTTPDATASLSPEPKSSPLSDGTFVAEEEGMSLTVTVSPTTIRPGESVTFTATFTNGRAVAVDYPIQWCGSAASVWLTLALPTEPYGRTWTSMAGEFKEAALTRGLGPGGVPATDPVRREVMVTPCEEGYRDALLAPGASVTSTHVWKADLALGIPVLPGRVPFSVGANFELQNGLPSFPPDYDGPRGSWAALYKSVGISGVIEVEGSRPTVLGPGEAIDDLLDDSGFVAWLDEEPSSTWSVINLFIEDNRNPDGLLPIGVFWEIDIFREMAVPRHWAIALVDAIDGGVRDAFYCDVPCDR